MSERSDAAGRRPARPEDLRIAGITLFSTVDWPDRLAATLFLQGCPWDCFYCHNPALIDPRARGSVSWDDAVADLESRRGLIDGVVLSGGEPTMQRATLPAIQELRRRGFAVGLHTAGAFPLLLARILPFVDWVGLDIKATADEYATVTGRARSGELAWRSLELVLASADLRRGTRHPLDYEVRTTAHPAATDDEELCRLGDDLAGRGVSSWAVQRARSTGARAPLPRVEAPDAGARLALDGLPSDRFAHLTVR
ncbi:anaerobic ribonucleoside-triphosphate reductase activating protein [Microbacterium thalassium]|uniref:Pyruvate formate lyase activating enzyme n=1 Tax=Microbacterium thalassium TaxID=362649 RepID=A0A7X0KUW3_9MICO|nr:anaerobic ribonucleoside-triphosphate reductase activating protein [Microbacterium thalassium]MBB6391592.1 pyruvate formate lyase activating enzyme [Microbacterium thalassium]GLK24195.1 anaerobic ribonucleoside-triphosphate reductase activating protein [Microbacterium thalassium]